MHNTLVLNTPSDNEYKANRQRPPLALLPLFGMAPQVLEEMGARCFQKSGYEADDIMASLSAWARRQGFQVVYVPYRTICVFFILDVSQPYELLLPSPFCPDSNPILSSAYDLLVLCCRWPM